MNRGENTVEHWDKKHQLEYGANEPYDFSKMGKNPLGYDTVAVQIIQENHNEIQNKSLLEIGCAVGYFVSYLKRYVIKDWKIEGWDFSPSGINAAKEKNKDVSGLTFEQRDFLLNPVQDDYGIICCFETIEHVEEGANYRALDNWLDHCEYLILSTVDTEDDCRGEHISHYKIDTFAKKGYNVVWSSLLAPIHMPDGVYHYFINLIKGKL